MTERVAFGAELRRARERRGLTLDAIAEQTKVSATHFAGLERGDLSRWPSGIFRRAFVRSYAVAVGLDADELVARFTRLFPDASDESRPAAAVPSSRPPDKTVPPRATAPVPDDDEDAPGSRLMLEQGRTHRPVVPLLGRVLAGVVDIAVAVLPAALVALGAGVSWFWPVAACVAMAGHLACFAALGTTPGAWLVGRLTAVPVTATPVPAERRRADAEAMPAPRRRVSRQGTRSTPHAHRVRH